MIILTNTPVINQLVLSVGSAIDLLWRVVRDLEFDVFRHLLERDRLVFWCKLRFDNWDASFLELSDIVGTKGVNLCWNYLTFF